jgi:hypothetical protein
VSLKLPGPSGSETSVSLKLPGLSGSGTGVSLKLPGAALSLRDVPQRAEGAPVARMGSSLEPRGTSLDLHRGALDFTEGRSKPRPEPLHEVDCR